MSLICIYCGAYAIHMHNYECTDVFPFAWASQQRLKRIGLANGKQTHPAGPLFSTSLMQSLTKNACCFLMCA